MPALTRAVAEDTDDYVRGRAAAALGMVLRLPDNNDIAKLLGEIGSEAETAVTTLVNALQDKNSGVRRIAAESLGIIGPPAKPAVAALLNVLKDGKVDRKSVAFALRSVDPEAAKKAGVD